MTLEESTAAALEAARTGDLDALTQALEARAQALQRGGPPTPGVLAAGELAADILRSLIRDTASESARLRQLAIALQTSVPVTSPPSFDALF